MTSSRKLRQSRIFKHPLTTVAAIDRVVHHSVILDLMGLTSYRAQAARTAQQVVAPPEEPPPTEEPPANWLEEVTAAEA
jgi:hypothetical protein